MSLDFSSLIHLTDIIWISRVPDMILGTKDIQQLNKTAQFPAFMYFEIQWER